MPRAKVIRITRWCASEHCIHFERRLERAETYFQCVEQLADIMSTKEDDLDEIRDIAMYLRAEPASRLRAATTLSACLEELAEICPGF